MFEVLQRLKDAGVEVQWVDASLSGDGPFSGLMMFLDSWRAGEEHGVYFNRQLKACLSMVWPSN